MAAESPRERTGSVDFLADTLQCTVHKLTSKSSLAVRDGTGRTLVEVEELDEPPVVLGVDLPAGTVSTTTSGLEDESAWSSIHTVGQSPKRALACCILAIALVLPSKSAAR